MPSFYRKTSIFITLLTYLELGTRGCVYMLCHANLTFNIKVHYLLDVLQVHTVTHLSTLDVPTVFLR